ncbi:MAG: hypothetical protein LAP39_30640 [Acidobacteriia bacterium]|nr:hypothetical protein [Terriglobia bacterium]
MSMSAKFKTFVHGLDPRALEELQQSVAAEIEGRQDEARFRVEDIHPRMSAADKELAASEIARVLRERG